MAQNLINNVVSKIPALQIIGLVSNVEDALSIVHKSKPNFILSTDSLIINEINKEFKFFRPKIILITNKHIRAQSIIENKYLLLGRLYNYEQMITKISYYIGYEPELTEEEQVTKLLLDLGFKQNLKGFKFLQESIVFTKAYRTQNHSVDDLINIVYPHVAQKFGTQVNNVKWSIERAINYTYASKSKSTYFLYSKYFSIDYPEKVTPKNLISTLANLIK